MPRYLKQLRPEAQIEVVEIDPDVIATARRFLELGDNLVVHSGDGRRVLAQYSAGVFDLIVNDAFHGVRNIPSHLLTREFNHRVVEHLSEAGVYAVNVTGHASQSQLVQGMITTLGDAFTHLSVLTE